MLSTTIASYNTQGIMNKHDSLQDIITSNNIDLFCFQETWMKEDTDLKMLKTVAKHCQEAPTHIDGGRRAFGGLLIIANAATAARCIFIRSTNSFIHITLDKINIINCYIPPSMDDDEIETIFQYAKGLEGQTLLCGDFNARLGELSKDSTIDKRGALCLKIH